MSDGVYFHNKICRWTLPLFLQSSWNQRDSYYTFCSEKNVLLRTSSCKIIYMESTERNTDHFNSVNPSYIQSMNPVESRSSGHYSLRPLLSQIIILPPPARRSAGHHVAMLEMLKADLVGADCCLIVLLRAAERWGLQQGFMRSGATAVDAAPMESNLAGFHWCAEAKVNRVMHL